MIFHGFGTPQSSDFLLAITRNCKLTVIPHKKQPFKINAENLSAHFNSCNTCILQDVLVLCINAHQRMDITLKICMNKKLHPFLPVLIVSVRKLYFGKYLGFCPVTVQYFIQIMLRCAHL